MQTELRRQKPVSTRRSTGRVREPESLCWENGSLTPDCEIPTLGHEHVFREISSLTVAEKFELLDAIWEDRAVQLPAVLGEEQSAELDRRVEGYEQDRTTVLPWEDVRADLFKQ